MPFKDLPQGTTQYLDEDGKLMENPSPEELERFKVDSGLKLSVENIVTTAPSNVCCMADICETFKFPIIINGKKFGDGEAKLNHTTKAIELEINNASISMWEETFFGEEARDE